MGALSDYMKSRWGVRTRTIEKVVSAEAGPTRTMVLENNPDRFEALIVNYNNAEMRIAPSVLVSDTRGIPLGADGGFTVLTADEDGEAVGYEWYVYSLLAAVDKLYIIEAEAA